MNPQLELHLQQFDQIGNGDSCFDSGRSSPTGSRGTEYQAEKLDDASAKKPVVSNDDIGDRVNVYTYMTFAFVLLAAAEWKQVFRLHLDVTLPYKTLSIPAGTALGCLLVYYFLTHRMRLDSAEARALPSSRDTCQPKLKASEDAKTKEKRHACRRVLSDVLGSLGGPFLIQEHDQEEEIITLLHQKSVGSTNNIPPPVGFYPQLATFAKSHATLIRTYDTTMEILKVATAIQLGATQNSAERVERALFGRRQTKQSDNTTTSKVAVSLPTTRSLLAEALKQQTNALATTIQDEDNGLEAHAVLGDFPPVITLTWLRSSRLQLVELLCHVLSKYSTGCSAMASSEGLNQLVQSTAVVEELRIHLQSALGLDEDCRALDHNQLQEGQQNVASLRQQCLSFFVAAWAMEDAIAQQKKHDSKEWWNRVNQLQEAMTLSLQDMHHDLFGTSQPLEADESEVPAEQGMNSAKKPSTTEQYTVETPSVTEARKSSFTKPTKTAVFSGKGALEPAPKHQRKSRAGPSNNTSSSADDLLYDPMAQHSLLIELQTRLITLALPEEEHEVCDDEEDHIPEDQYEEKTTSVPLFLGATGSLLVGELKNTMKLISGHNGTSEEIISGDDD